MKIAPYWRKPNFIPWNMRKGELADLVFPPDLTFDYAIPQEWLNQFSGDEYDRIASSCVTCYPKGSIFGEVVNMLTGEILS